MKKLFVWAEERVHNFTVWDIGMLKVCLFSLGAFFGLCAGERTRKTAPWFLVAFFCSYAALIYRLAVGVREFRNKLRNNSKS